MNSIQFDLFLPASNREIDNCNWAHNPMPKGGMFENVSWGMHASTSGFMCKPNQRVVLHPVTDSDCAYIPSAGGYSVEAI